MAGRGLPWGLSPAGWGSWKQQPGVRERKYRHLGSSSLQRRECQEHSERHLVLFFSHCLQQLGHWGYSPAGSPCQEALPRDNRLSIGSFSFRHPDRDWCYDQESDPTCLGYSSLSQSRRGQLGAPGRPGEDPGVRHSGQVSRLLICVLRPLSGYSFSRASVSPSVNQLPYRSQRAKESKLSKLVNSTPPRPVHQLLP